MWRSRWHFMKELKEAIKTLWNYIANILRSPLREYADGLYGSWNYGKPNQVFQFLLKQADQGDLDMAKEKYAMSTMKNSVKPLTKHPSQPHPQDQESSPIEKVTVLAVLASITDASDEIDQAASSRTIYSVRRKRRRKASRRCKKRAQRIPQTEQRPSCTHSN